MHQVKLKSMAPKANKVSTLMPIISIKCNRNICVNMIEIVDDLFISYKCWKQSICSDRRALIH